MEIDDVMFSKFVGNALTHKQMVEVERELITDREFSAAIEASVIEYKIRKKDADELLGIEDNDFYQEKKSEKIVRIDNLVDSEREKVTIKTTNNKFFMNINLTKEELLKIQELSTEFNNNEDKSLSLNENLITFYLNQRPGTSKEESEKILEGLTKGVRLFHEEMTDALKNEGVDYVGKLHEMGEKLTNEQKYEIYINFLSMLTVLDVQNFDEENAAQIEDFQTIKNKYTVKGEVTDEMLDEVIEKISNALIDNTFCLATTETIGVLFEKINETVSIEDYLSGSEKDYRIKLVNAMVTYIAYQKGEISSLAGQEVEPEIIAVGAAVGVEQARTIESFRLGRISWEQALGILKIIGGIALFCILLLPFISATATFMVVFYATLTNMLGGSIMAILLSGVVSLYLSFQLGESMSNAIMSIIDVCESGFDKVVKCWQDTAWPFIKERANAISGWLKEKKEDNTIDVVPGSELQMDVVTQS